MSALNDLIDIELLLSARTQGLAAFTEAESGLGGLAKAGAAAGIVVAIAVAEAAKQSAEWAAESPHDLPLIFGKRK